MTRRLNRLLGAIAVLVGVPYWWLLVDNSHAAVAPLPLHVDRLRALAAALPGPRPSGIEVEVVARRNVPGAVVAAGIGLRPVTLVAPVWRLPVAGGAPVMINAGMTARQAEHLGFEEYDAAAQGRVDAALARAGLVISPGARTPQIPAGPDPHALAPGVVAIPAAGRVAGAGMLFVTLADGRELLLAREFSALDRNWRELRGRSRLSGGLHPGQDRTTSFGWLATIQQLKREAPALLVVPGNDGDWLARAEAQHVVRAGYSG